MKVQKKRSKLRRFLGTIWYAWKKQYEWYCLPKKRFAQIQQKTNLPHCIFEHQSLLLRKLNSVDMQLQRNKITNLKIAVAKLDGLLLRPGETFSYWRQIGKPSRRKGYLEGMILREGKVLSGIGGGLCQLSNLLYWMTLHTPLTVVERWRHSYDVFPDARRTQPFGSGATCSYPNIDLQIRNDTESTFQLRVEVGETHLQGHWYSDTPCPYEYQIREVDHSITTTPWAAGQYLRNNRLLRQTKDINGEVIQEEIIAENHALMMYAPLLERKKDY